MSDSFLDYLKRAMIRTLTGASLQYGLSRIDDSIGKRNRIAAGLTKILKTGTRMEYGAPEFITKNEEDLEADEELNKLLKKVQKTNMDTKRIKKTKRRVRMKRRQRN